MLYVADFGNHRIQRFHPIGNVTGETVACNGAQGISLYQLSNPTSLAIDVNAQKLFVAEAGTFRVASWNLKNYTEGGTCIIGCSESEIGIFSYGLTFHSHGSLFLVHGNENRIRKFNPPPT
ncbi:unnamed protein product [Didymodactylos carnosus]|uniref:Uncharacterized protein n=1 Tax=Didymodactylos carnosus TaxID=1234261 RepID=A0A815PPM9_9BILA|nr:unnamed protein product [Didymodactylos carnosus]CAF1451477.1 unnamed protein product [Didymodactylos carnosus]CAF4009356.1 unnamed protein product [Didymodactylos carnosus]CAF4324633.1 unnamed protein product [Didymodactylos carnosus]